MAFNNVISNHWQCWVTRISGEKIFNKIQTYVQQTSIVLIMNKTNTYNYTFEIWAWCSIFYWETLRMIKIQREEVAEREDENEERGILSVFHASHICCVLT